MAPTPLPLVFVRSRGELSLLTLPVTAIDEERALLETTARDVLARQTPLTAPALSLASDGDPVDCRYAALEDTGVQCRTEQKLTSDTTVRLRPLLFDYRLDPDNETQNTGLDWDSPITLLPDDTTSPLRQAYDTVRPTVERIEADSEHGSATLSVRALEVLRDEAMLSATDGGEHSSVTATAQSLVDARPTMTVLANRIARVVAGADSTDPRGIAHTAQAEIERALSVDREAARNVSHRLDGKRVATLSRSGTVSRALRFGNPAAVLVAHSLPGGEGVGVAESFGSRPEPTLTSDAAFPGQLREWNADVLLVGADSILGDGRVVNKVGTFPAAVTATEAAVDVIVATATDKISPRTSFDPEHRSPEEMMPADDSVVVENPTFEATSLSYVDAVVTEKGALTLAQITAIASDYAARREPLS